MNAPSSGPSSSRPPKRRFRKKFAGKRPHQSGHGAPADQPAAAQQAPVPSGPPKLAEGFAHLGLAECLLRSLGD
jgi:hypothetical protein